MAKELSPMQALCQSGCGFFGSPANDGHCSLCYKNLKKNQQSPVAAVNFESSPSNVASSTAVQPITTSVIPDVISDPPSPTVSKDHAVSATEKALKSDLVPEEETVKDSKKKKNRCVMCRKKVGLTGFGCRCGGLFCSMHRYSDQHSCTFDYRGMGAEEIRRRNPLIVAEKVQKI